ncbi:glutamate formiminotransferase [Candidatus Margulisiibacteriota bacterium]
MPKIVECVPNVSEGRNFQVIEKLANVIRANKEVQLLDVHRDVDHNRSVYTFIGSPKGVKQTAYDLAERAVELIDINKHEGVHPKLGVIDVIPFIPVKNVTMAECKQLSRKLGAELEKHLHLPVYFYEEATDDPKTKNLADLRAQGYNLKKHYTAGAVAISARDYLIAYNVNLSSKNVDIARKIAAELREKNGGLAGVKALGLKLASKQQVQVSMNLIKPKQTPPGKVLNTIKRLAGKIKVKVAATEIVGLMPKEVQEAAEKFKI